MISISILYNKKIVKIAYIYNNKVNKKMATWAHHINDLIVCKLQEYWIEVKSFFPSFRLKDTPINFEWIKNILFFYSLLEHRDKILKYDIIQGTTFTPIAFLSFKKPIVSHFGSTTIGFLNTVPKTHLIEKECEIVLYELKKLWIISDVDIKSLASLNDIVLIEKYAAQKANYIIATSQIVKRELLKIWIFPEKIEVIHNAIEDYWFLDNPKVFSINPRIVFLWRIGEDPFTFKLKWLDRLIYLYNKFPEVQKLSIVMTRSKKIIYYLKENISNNRVEANSIKENIPGILAENSGSILLITSRYEWFSLSLIEWMSQWLIPICFPVWVIPEIISNWENWFIVNDIYEAEEKIKYILENDYIRKKLSENAILTSKNFKAEILSKKLINLYERILEKVG